MRVPHTRPGNWPGVAAGRLAERLAPLILGDVPDEAALRARPKTIALLGLPDDTGIALNGGRMGAAEGPSAFRRALAGYGTAFDAARGSEPPVGLHDAGDVIPAEGTDAEAMDATHERVREAVAALHSRGFVPVCVGGGHDLTYPAVRALAEGSGPLGGVNVDAHLDVRERPGSGMPFRALIEGGWVEPERFTVFGAGRFANLGEHVAWLVESGAEIVPMTGAADAPGAFRRVLDRARSGEGSGDASGSNRAREASLFVSFDLDALDGAFAPGVSAVNPAGLDVPTATRIAEEAGRAPGVRHFDLMELSPPHDVDGRTARVAALLFLHFVAGFSERAE
ncbi:MAG: formimidoylglutamase [Longimicrobiales bacterium]|nr:formimidoylglutamase [Longimicrobiales bacterium]